MTARWRTVFRFLRSCTIRVSRAQNFRLWKIELHQTLLNYWNARGLTKVEQRNNLQPGIEVRPGQSQNTLARVPRDRRHHWCDNAICYLNYWHIFQECMRVKLILHDTLEDTDTTAEELEAVFGVR